MSPYSNPEEVTMTPIEPKPSDVNEILKDKGRWAGDAVDWVVSTFGDILGFGDKGLYDYLVLPICGDFGRITANGEAWADCGRMIGIVGKNLVKTATTLVTSDWTGEAAKAFFKHVDVVLGAGLYVAVKGCGFMQKGFDKLAELSIKIARMCAELLDRIMEMILRLAAKAVPGLGQLFAFVEWVATGFDRTPYLADVEEIKALVQKVLGLHAAMTKLVESIQAYFKGLQAVVDAVAKIPEVDSISEAGVVVEDAKDGIQEAKKARADVDKRATEVDTQLGEVSNQVDVMTR